MKYYIEINWNISDFNKHQFFEIDKGDKMDINKLKNVLSSDIMVFTIWNENDLSEEYKTDCTFNDDSSFNNLSLVDKLKTYTFMMVNADYIDDGKKILYKKFGKENRYMINEFFKFLNSRLRKIKLENF